MAFTTSSHISTLALTAVLSAGLILGGCGKKDDVKAAASSALSISKSDIASALKVKPRDVTDSEAEKALKGLSLLKSGDGMVKWDARDGANGNYTFKNVTFMADGADVPVNVKRLELMGAHMDDGSASVDKMVLSEVSFADDGAKGAIAAMTIVNPSPDLTNVLASTLNGNDVDEAHTGSMSFDAMDIQNMTFTSDESSATLGTLFISKNGQDDDATGSLVVRDMTIDAIDNDGDVKMSIESVDVVDFNIEKYKPLMQALKDSGGAATMDDLAILNSMQSMNSLEPDFKAFSIQNFDADVDGLTIDFDKINATSDVKGDVVTIVQNMPPLTITPPAKSDDPEMQQLKEALSAMNYEKLAFSFHQETKMNKATDSAKIVESYIDMKDGFRLHMDFDGSGINAFQKKQAELSVKGGGQNPADAIDMFNELDIRHMGFKLEDKSIMDRAFAYAALQQGGSADTLKTHAKAGMGMLALMAQDDAQREFFGELGGALSKFIDEGGTLAFDMKPKEGFNLSELISGAGSGQIDVKSMGLTVSHK